MLLNRVRLVAFTSLLAAQLERERMLSAEFIRNTTSIRYVMKNGRLYDFSGAPAQP